MPLRFWHKDLFFRLRFEVWRHDLSTEFIECVLNLRVQLRHHLSPVFPFAEMCHEMILNIEVRKLALQNSRRRLAADTARSGSAQQQQGMNLAPRHVISDRDG